ERVDVDLQSEHFVMFKETETVQIVLEDAFGVEPGSDSDRVALPHREEAGRMIVRCLFGVRERALDIEEIIDFFQLFSRSARKPEHERTMRYKTMAWFAYMLIDLIKIDRQRVCHNGAAYFKATFKELLDRAIEGRIISEDVLERDFEGGRWNGTLFGWLQGEDRKAFAERLKKQFNLENRARHANRLLLAVHRDCIYRQAVDLFCR
ncbi:MAG: hypothetical protein ACLGPL_11960, partial [Acidobacteriota bacterium]